MAQLPDIAKLVICIGASQAAGGIGSIFTSRTVSTWYPALRKPVWTPPGVVFGPVWISLYVLMGIAAYLVWRKGLGHEWVKVGLILFLFQLVLNAGWSAAFFGIPSPLAGFIVIIPLWAAILATLIVFMRVATAAGLLLIPYLAWVSFAAALNWSIYALNR